MKKGKRILKVIGFLFILGLIFARLNLIFIRKANVKPMDMMNKIVGYFNEKEKHDVLFFGTSQAYTSFDTEFLAEKGLSSYVLATQQQPIEASYYYIREAIKRSSPKLIYIDVLDVLTFNQVDEGISHSYTDYFPMSVNKLLMIKQTLPKDQWAEHLMPLIKYHSRWKELDRTDIFAKWKDYHDDLNGFVKLTNDKNGVKDDPELNEILATAVSKAGDNNFRQEKYEVLKKIYDYGNKKGVKVVFLKTPVYLEDLYDKNIGPLDDYLQSIGSKLLDLTKVSKEIDFEGKDYFDVLHLSGSGARKFTEYFYENYIVNDL